MGFFHAQNTSTAVQMVTTHGTYMIAPLHVQRFQRIASFFLSTVILELRLYAMYGRSRKILALLLFLISCEATAMGVLFGMTRPGLIGE
jgi:hypothetical protein